LEFQFRFGSIDSLNRAGRQVKSSEFQFRFGSIDSPTEIPCPDMLPWFQFRFGSIDSPESRPFLHRLVCFNSALVRLIAGNDKARHTASTKFQFRFGSIDSWNR